MNGILFKDWKIQAIRDNPDREWQTRRLSGLYEINQEPNKWTLIQAVRDISLVKEGDYVCQHTDGHCVVVKPRYRVGEVVYIKEAYKVLDFDLGDIDKPLQRVKVEYKLDSETRWVMKPVDKRIVIPDKWHSPMMMPKWSARYFIKITSVRPERAQEISQDDALAEGVTRLLASQLGISVSPSQEIFNLTQARRVFSSLWDSINAKPRKIVTPTHKPITILAYSLSSNPWLWRYEFTVNK